MRGMNFSLAGAGSNLSAHKDDFADFLILLV